MAQVVTSRDELNLYLEASDGGIYKQVLKYPVLQSETLVTKINGINESLAGGLNGLWYADKSVDDSENLPTITRIIKAEYYTQTTARNTIFDL